MLNILRGEFPDKEFRLGDETGVITFPFSDDVHASLVSDCGAGYAYITSDGFTPTITSAV